VDVYIPAEETMNDLPLRPAAEFGAVEDRFFTLRNFQLTDGAVMLEATIAYETYGRLAPGGRNAILCTHGYTGSHHFAGRNPANGNQRVRGTA
jgi:homoserine O-acetyltransferase